MADVTIVDNIVRAIPKMVEFAEELRDSPREELEAIVRNYDNREVLRRAIEAIRDYLTETALRYFNDLE